MPPEHAPFDPQRILRVLAGHQVQCVVIGGYAAVLAGIDIVTRASTAGTTSSTTRGTRVVRPVRTYGGTRRTMRSLGGDYAFGCASLQTVAPGIQVKGDGYWDHNY
jgi:hypothetical protein